MNRGAGYKDVFKDDLGIYAYRIWGQKTLENIAKHYRCLSANVSKATRDVQKRLKTEVKLKKIVIGLKRVVFEEAVDKK